MNRRLQFFVVACSTCVVVLLLFGAVHGRSAAADNPYGQIGVYGEVLSRIKMDYVEEPDMKSVTLGAISGLLESLDPFASYLNADQYKQYQAAKSAHKPDVGLVLSKRFGYLSVVDAVPGSPAAKQGLTTGDVIESINNVSTRDMPLAFADQLFQGEAGSSIEISVLRTRKSEAQKVKLTRAAVVQPPVSGKLNGDIGVIATTSLAPGRAKDIAAKIADLEKQGAKKLILDLRHCSTGVPTEGIEVANLFMDKGLITYSQGQKTGKENTEATAAKAVTKLPLAVIVNRSTSGAAEIAAGALLDSKRAEVIGERTYGEAAVRKAITMDDGSAVILAVAKYYSPSGISIPDKGVTPSVAEADTDAPAGETDDDSDQQEPAPKPSGDHLLERAVKVLNGVK
jgi:carboxyl-terminal processing protease